MARRITPAVDQLVDQLTAALAASTDELLAGAIATTDPDAAVTAAQGGGSLLIGPPTFDEWTWRLDGGLDVSWTIQAAAAAGAAGPRRAWDRLDALLDVVAGVVDVTAARPGRAPVPGSTAVLHVYLITTDTTTIGAAP